VAQRVEEETREEEGEAEGQEDAVEEIHQLKVQSSKFKVQRATHDPDFEL
jgi:hypothetical protein